MAKVRLCSFVVSVELVYVLQAAASYLHLVRIPIESGDQLRFTGIVQVGSPPRSVRVVFDTGSSDTWVTSNHFAANADDAPSLKAFTIGYGSGIVSGLTAPAYLQIGGQLESNTNGVLVRDIPVGFVDDQVSMMTELDAQGVVGLGMEALAQIRSNLCLLRLIAEQQVVSRPVVFSVYISSWTGAQPPSQLILGGDDPALTNSYTTWFTFPVISNDELRGHRTPVSDVAITKNSFGFWVLRMQSMYFDNEILPLGPASHQGAVLLDSGTSVLLLPQYAFDAVVQALMTRFGIRFLAPRGRHQTLPACRRCQVHEFPPLSLDLLLEDGTKSETSSQRFVLQGSDYVRCDQQRRECTALIDSFQSSEVSDRFLVVVLGTVFLRSYYTRFDYSNKQVALACTVDERGVCPGGFKPALDHRGQPYQPYSEALQVNRYLTALCIAITALALLIGLRLLLESYEKRVV
ncbi:hypothetical protein PF008_g2058 [Phytophthora fragariae]|uniref:Peptidase A1 domain-containing protein n=1 Tax=Phytophthora fragariae TaxID=53985 RepID=A0A6G0SIV7_9STRA|nr:hypothetical protein PF008_g2058 [Phytophthora fragariae]